MCTSLPIRNPSISYVIILKLYWNCSWSARCDATEFDLSRHCVGKHTKTRTYMYTYAYIHIIYMYTYIYMHACIYDHFVCVYMYVTWYTYKHSRGIFAKSIKEKELRSKELLAESLAHSALEVIPCQKVLRIDKLQSVKEVIFYRQLRELRHH